mmetsp:Transcript_5346/g.11826  ORF Transcript_5346/g.11826 Transcript_5346/m.11826 type:complete len:355 (+) Transcript_5346:97-1161(+)
MPIASVAVIRSVQQRRRKRGDLENLHERQLRAGLVAGPPPEEEVDVNAIIEENRFLPKMAGVLTKQTVSGPFGLLGETSQARYFELDPSKATLSYWESESEPFGPPKRKLPLRYLEEVDLNWHHRLLFLHFRGLRVMQLEARTEEDYRDWVEMLSKYRSPSQQQHLLLPGKSKTADLTKSGATARPDASDDLSGALAKTFVAGEEAAESPQSLLKKGSRRMAGNRQHRSRRAADPSAPDTPPRRRRRSQDQEDMDSPAEVHVTFASQAEEEGGEPKLDPVDLPESWLKDEVIHDLDAELEDDEASSKDMSSKDLDGLSERERSREYERLWLEALLREEEEHARMLQEQHTIIRW